jgi:hypothetical protein
LIVLLVTLLFLCAAAFTVVGIHMLAGLAWAFIVFGMLLFGAAIYLRSGLKPNG